MGCGRLLNGIPDGGRTGAEPGSEASPSRCYDHAEAPWKAGRHTARMTAVRLAIFVPICPLANPRKSS